MIAYIYKPASTRLYTDEEIYYKQYVTRLQGRYSREKMNSGQIIMDGINIREDMEKWLGRLGYLPIKKRKPIHVACTGFI